VFTKFFGLHHNATDFLTSAFVERTVFEIHWTWLVVVL